MKVSWDLSHMKHTEKNRKDYHGDFIVDQITQNIIIKDFRWYVKLIISPSYLLGIVLIFGLFKFIMYLQNLIHENYEKDDTPHKIFM